MSIHHKQVTSSDLTDNNHFLFPNSRRDRPRADGPDGAEDVAALRPAVDGRRQEPDAADGTLRHHLAAFGSRPDRDRTPDAALNLVRLRSSCLTGAQLKKSLSCCSSVH